MVAVGVIGPVVADHPAGTTTISPSFVDRNRVMSCCSTLKRTFGVHEDEAPVGAARASCAPNWIAETAADAEDAADDPSCGSTCSSSSAARPSGSAKLLALGEAAA